MSEYVCCHILQIIGVNVQNTLFGHYQRISSKGDIRDYPVVACELFDTDRQFIDFKSIENAFLDSKPGKIPKIEELYEIFNKHEDYFYPLTRDDLVSNYWDTFICDALLGNFDRHANNWGYLQKDDQVSLSPVYDCGSCLYPQISDESIEKILNNRDEIQMRIDKFPTAALELSNKQKANYKNYIISFSNQDCTDALLRIYPKIDMPKICEFIDSLEYASDIRKKFYKTMLTERYEQLLKRPYLLYAEISKYGLQNKAEDISAYINNGEPLASSGFSLEETMIIDEIASHFIKRYKNIGNPNA
jgi:hypothetical protein